MFSDRNLYTNTPDSDLTYTGNDSIVWDRINAERLRRGLPGLAAIGYPRPPDETGATGSGQTYSFTEGGQTYEVGVPSGMSESEARALFEREFNAGKLTNLNLGQSLEGLSAQASSTLSKIAGLANVPVSLPVSPVEILKQVPSNLSIGSLDPKQVTGLLGQASAAVGQAASTLSPDKGIGKFGLTPQQLQDQGFLKPGTVEQFIGRGNVDFTSVLKSPACWTGQSGVNGIDGFLNNTNIQNNVQQTLMTKGFDQLKSLGTITGNEGPQQLAAMVQGASKFGAATMAAWAKGIAPAGLVGDINNLAKGAQFATDLVGKLPDVAPSIEGAINTVNRATVDNSVKSFVGDSKVPSPTYGPVQREEVKDVTRADEEKWITAAGQFADRLNYYQNQAQEIAAQLADLESGTITQGGWATINAKFESVKAEFNAERQQLQDLIQNTYNSLPEDLKTSYSRQYAAGFRAAKIVVDFLKYLRDRIKDDEALIGT